MEEPREICPGFYFRIPTDFGICYTYNMMATRQIFEPDVHEDFLGIIPNDINITDEKILDASYLKFRLV